MSLTKNCSPLVRHVSSRALLCAWGEQGAPCRRLYTSAASGGNRQNISGTFGAPSQQ